MCGRARCTLNREQVARACYIDPDASFPAVDLDRHRPSYNVSPGAYLPVVAYRRGGGGEHHPQQEEGGDGGDGADERRRKEEASVERPVLHCMKWGLVPSFTKKTEKPDHYRMFNARSESIREKASFRRLLPNNRCLVAAEGFYEWKKDGSKKQPYYIHFKDNRPLVFAALYDSWRNPEGEVLCTFTILTTCSSSALQWLHDRMPVILGDKSSIDLWLNSPASKVDSALGPYEGPDLVWYPVTPAMGKPSVDGPECVEEIKVKPAEKDQISKFFTKKKIDDRKQHDLDIKNLSEESSATDQVENLKEPCAKENTTEFGDDKEGAKHEVSHLVKKETETCGTKRDYEQLRTGLRPPSGYIDDLNSDAPKKVKSEKTVGDGQATLLSYFGRRS